MKTIDEQDLELTDEILMRLVQDFASSQEKLKAQMQRAKDAGAKKPQYSHYTLAETALENFAKNYAA